MSCQRLPYPILLSTSNNLHAAKYKLMDDIEDRSVFHGSYALP